MLNSCLTGKCCNFSTNHSNWMNVWWNFKESLAKFSEIFWPFLAIKWKATIFYFNLTKFYWHWMIIYQYWTIILSNFVILNFCFCSFQKFLAKFQTLSNFRNFSLDTRKWWRKVKKSILQLPICIWWQKVRGWFVEHPGVT